MIDIDKIAIDAIEERIGLPISQINLVHERMLVASAVMATVKALSVLQREYEEKLRWIPIEEKLPEITGWDKAPYIVKTKKEYLIAGYTDGWFHHIGGLCLKKGAVTHYRSFL